MSAQLQTNGHTPPAAPSFSEAPASATLRVVSANGFEILLTTRAGRMADLLSQLTTLESWLVDHQWQAAPTGKGKATQGTQGDGDESDAPLCAIHKTPMVRRSKDGRSWWSCSHKLDTGEWCPYRPKQ